MRDESWNRVIDMDVTEIIVQTKDYLVIRTEDLLDTMRVLQQAWWTLLDMIDDDYFEPKRWLRCERTMLCYGKWALLKEFNS